MNRRGLIIGVGATLCAPTLAMAQAPATAINTRPVGEWDERRQVFNWREIDVDFFGRGERHQSLSVALALFGVREDDRPVIMARIERSPGQLNAPDEIATIEPGHFYLAMVSGGIRSPQAYVTQNVVPHPNPRWSSRLVRVYRVRVGTRNYTLACPGCWNWLLLQAEQYTFDCVCRPGLDLGPRCRRS